MPQTNPIVPTNGTLKDAHKALVDGLPLGLAFTQRLPHFLEVFDVAKGQLGVSEMTVNRWLGGGNEPSERSLRDVEKGAKKALKDKDFLAPDAERAARWLTRGSPTEGNKRAPAAPENIQETAEAVASNSSPEATSSPTSWDWGHTEPLQVISWGRPEEVLGQLRGTSSRPLIEAALDRISQSQRPKADDEDDGFRFEIYNLAFSSRIPLPDRAERDYEFCLRQLEGDLFVDWFLHHGSFPTDKQLEAVQDYWDSV